jgi:Tol biopolymer transport system component
VHRKGVLAAAIAAFIALTAAGPAGAASSDGRLAFDGYDRDTDSYEIYSMRPDGKDRVHLTRRFGADAYFPEYSPDGKWIAFQCEEEINRDRSVPTDICIVRDTPNGRHARLTDLEGSETSISFSPDGKRILFTGGGDGGQAVYVMKRDGSGVTRLTDPTTVRGVSGPSFSADGSQIIFSSFSNGEAGGIYLMNSDGTGLVNITDDAVFNDASEGSLSPDGSRVLFKATMIGEPDVEVWSSDLQGGSLIRLSDNKYDNESYLAWSPSGDLIAFETGSRHQIHTARPDGTELGLSVNNDSFNLGQPAFSPNGKQFVLQMKHFGDSEIGIATPGKGTKRLTRTNRIHEGSPVWGP